MPFVTFNTKKDFDDAYDFNAEPEGHPSNRQGIRLGYCRQTMMPYCKRRAQALVDIFNWPRDTKIVIVGAGYGWTIECLINDHNYTDVIGTDTSKWIQNNKNTDETVDVEEAIRKIKLNPQSGEGLRKKQNLVKDIRCKCTVLDEDLLTPESRNNVGQKDIAISECVISTLTDDEVLQLSNAMHLIANQVLHMDISFIGQKTNYNWKTAEQWNQLLPNDVFFDLNGY